jgi:lysophospholipase L1-like esterase
LALGDSYTIGEGVAPSERWPSRVADRLRARGLEVGQPEVVAVTGWTTDELAAGIEAADLGPPYDAVTLLIGVNNQYRGGDLEIYRREHAGLLRRAVAFAGGDTSRVVAVSFPDWGVTPFAADRDAAQIALEVDAFNGAARATALEAGVAWVDITPTSRTQGDLVAADRLHPSADAYAAWAERIAPALERALR